MDLAPAPFLGDRNDGDARSMTRKFPHPFSPGSFYLILKPFAHQDAALALSPQLSHKLVFDTTHERLCAGGHVVSAEGTPKPTLHIPRTGG
jgi:hypothetical protein